MHSSYYEAILQVRPRFPEAEKFVEKNVREGGKAAIARRKVFKEGKDYYMTSWKAASALAQLLVKRFGGSVAVSRKLFGRDRKTGKVLYRSAVLYRSHSLARGDVVACGGRVLVVSSVGKNTVFGRDVMSGRKGRLGSQWERLEKHRALVSRTAPHVEVISPEDYQSVRVENSSGAGKSRLRVVFYMGRAYSVD